MASITRAPQVYSEITGGVVSARTEYYDTNTLSWVAWDGTLGANPGVTIGTVAQGAGGASAWKVDGSAVTQPISGAVSLQGEMDNGLNQAVAVTPEGHIEVAVHGPRLPFGSIHAERIKPIFQSDGVYGINSFSMLTSTGLSVGTGSGSGAVSASSNRLVCATGATQYSFASLQSRRRLRYRAGQGVIIRAAGGFSTPAANQIAVIGAGTAETTLAYGYNGTAFGILYSTGGVREIHTLTITTASTATNNYVVTLPNTATVNVTATNNGSLTQTAYEISKGTFPGWTAQAVGATVVFLANSAGNKSGSFSLAQTGAATPAAGTDAETLAGVAATDTWIAQTAWNGDVMDGSGSASNPSGILLDTSKGNVFQIHVQYLGYGDICFDIEVTPTNGNNPEFVRVHTIRYTNTSSAVSMSQPSFPFLMAASSAGGTSDVSCFVGSFSGFIEGDEVNLGPRVSYDRDSVVTSSTTVFKPLFTVRNSLVFSGRANQSIVKLIEIAGSTKGNANAQTKFYIVRNAALTGPVNFTAVGGSSACEWDSAATGMSDPSQSQKIWSIPVVESASFEHAFADHEITLQPGESVTICVKSIAATADCMASLNTREDQ